MFKRMSALLLIAVATASVLIIGDSPAQAGGGCHEVPPGVNDGAGTTVSIEKCKYIPTVVRIDPGDTIQWTNNDNVVHTVTGVADNWGDYKEYDRGASVSHTFAAEGTFPYFCELHPGMVGAVVVGDGDGSVDSADAAAGVLAVSEDQPGAPVKAAAATDGQDGGGSDVGRYLVIGIVSAVICAAIVLAGLRLAGSLPRA
jgi:plastocyanin